MTSKINPSTESHGEGEGEGAGGEHLIPLQSKPVVQPQGNVEVEQPKETPTDLKKNAGDEFEWDNIAKKSLGIRLVGFFVAKFRPRIGWVAFQTGEIFSIFDRVV